jgi:myosin-5
VGRTKIFFRPGVLGFVEDKWAAMQSAALRIQVGNKGEPFDCSCLQ